jgi:hypothetical protein
VVIALQQWAGGFPWLRSVPARIVMCLRAVEVFAVAVGATLGTHSFNPLGKGYAFNDVVALTALVALSLGLVWLVWAETAPRADDAPVESR